MLAIVGLLAADEARVWARGVEYLLAAVGGARHLSRIRRDGGPAWPAFWVLIASCAGYAASNAVRALAPGAAAGETLNAVASVLLLVAGITFVRRIRPGQGLPVLLDGLIVGVMAVLLLREVGVVTGDTDTARTTTSVLLVMGLVGTAMWLRAVATDPSAPVRLFALAAGIAIPGIAMAAVLGIGPVRPRWVDVWTLTSSAVLVRALTHPQLRTLDPSPAPPYRRVTAGAVALMLLTLSVGPGLVWVRAVTGRAPDAFLAWGLTLLTALWVARFAVMLAARDLRHGRLDRQLRTDHLTQVRSRAGVLDLLEDRLTARGRAPGAHDHVGVLLVDVDGFKGVNDTHGHLIGDRVLVGLARALEAAAGDDGVVGRLSGDEFAVVVLRDHEAVCERVRRTMAEGVVIADDADGRAVVRVRASVGAASTREEPDATPLVLLHRADEAMYEAKRLHGTTRGLADRG